MEMKSCAVMSSTTLHVPCSATCMWRWIQKSCMVQFTSPRAPWLRFLTCKYCRVLQHTTRTNTI